MKTRILGFGLFVLTAAVVAGYPSLKAKTAIDPPPVAQIASPNEAPIVDVVFVLDTTGSMSGLIQTAKEKIWSIATTMAGAQPTPEIRIGLVAYRDRGDTYVTRVVDLSDDLDSVYANLMDFVADGGGDGPESVNKALHDAVHNVSWSQRGQAYRVIFLVGDAPPHMDYQDEVRYPDIMAAAQQRGIVVNTIQCGDMPATVDPWTQIAHLGMGSYFQVEQAGGAVAYSTPFDAELAELSAKLDANRMYFGSDDEKLEMKRKMDAADKLHALASTASRARRATFNVGAAGKVNRLGNKELVDAVTSGEVALDEIEEEALPESLQVMAPEEREAYVAGAAEERAELERQIRVLADDRDRYLRERVEEAGGEKDSLDQKIFDAVSEQASGAGLIYRDGPDY